MIQVSVGRQRAGGALFTPAREAKSEVYKELGYRVAGMVGEHLTVARPMVKAKGHIVQVIESDGKTMKTLDARASASRPSNPAGRR